MNDWSQITEASDVTEGHIAAAADMRDGLYGGTPLPWDEVINRLERSDEDWGSSMESEAIKHLQREVRKVLKDRAA